MSQISDINCILSKFFRQNILFITKDKPSYFNQIPSANKYITTAFLKVKNNQGVIFENESWPFRPDFFDVIILDNILLDVENLILCLTKVEEHLSKGGVLCIFQFGGMAFKMLSRSLKGSSLEIFRTNYYDRFTLSKVKSWLPVLLPEYYALYFNAIFIKKNIFLTLLQSSCHVKSNDNIKYTLKEI